MKYLNYQGRLNRMPYIFLSIFFGIIIAAADSYRQYNPQPTAAGLAIVAVIELLCILIISVFTVKRFHDLGKPGWYFWLQLIPIYNIYLWVLLLARRGAIGPNTYGSDPLSKA